MPKSNAKRLRLQFSLRGLLLLVSLIGAGLTVYRWPWVETTEGPYEDGYLTTTYRRGWNGQRLKHGLRRWWNHSDGKFWSEAIYVDDSIRYSSSSDGIQKKCYYDSIGRLHGPYSEYKLSGQYVHGQKAGIWQFHETPDHLLVRQYQADLPHGEWLWKKQGLVVQSARFQQGRLVEWNGRPIAEAWEHWLDANGVDSLTGQVLATPVDQVDLEHWSHTSSDAAEWPIRGSEQRLILNCHSNWETMFYRLLPPRELGLLRQDPARPASEAFVEQALINGRHVEFHYGVVCFVPFSEEPRQTGIEQMSFAPDSDVERAWVELVADPFPDVTAKRVQNQEHRFQQLFADCAMEVDASQVRDKDWRYPSIAVCDPPRLRRPRRDVLGLILYSKGWTCRQQGNVIEICAEEKK